MGRIAAWCVQTSSYATPEPPLAGQSIHDKSPRRVPLGTTSTADITHWKWGKATSLRIGEEYQPATVIEHGASGMHDEAVVRSMACRKKGVNHQTIELTCSHPSCGKVFTRECDLAKHEKTRSRPFKCPEQQCKYHE